MAEEEIWKPVVGYEGFYSVSNLGRVRSEERVVPRSRTGPKPVRSRVLRLCEDRFGYRRVNLSRSGFRRPYLVHVLVAEAFLGPRTEGMRVLHGPLGPGVNSIDNLSYGTQSDNLGRDRLRDGTLLRGESHCMAKLTEQEIREIRAATGTHDSIALEYDVSRTLITLIRLRRRWRHVE